MQGLTLTAITISEKCTLMLDSTKIMEDEVKSQQSHSSANLGQEH